MNTRAVDARTLLAVLAMEAGLALPIISLPSQGDRVPGVLGPLLLLLLLPLGYLAVREVPELRDPSWRLLAGIGLALATRAVVGRVPEPDLRGLAIWFGSSVVPMAIGVALWWRGGALGVAELTALDVRTEFSILAVLLLGTLALIRPFVLGDAVLLGTSAGLFVVGGLQAATFARQDAAEAASPGPSRALAATSALLPAGAAVLLVSILRPSVMSTLWAALVAMIELVLTPIGWLLAWLASLLPSPGAAVPAPPPRFPNERLMPNPETLAQLEERNEWVGVVALILAMLLVTILALVVVRMLLANWIGSPPARAAPRGPELTVERSGTPRGDAQDLLGWLLRWLRQRLGGRTRDAKHGGPGADVAAADAWAVYRRLLEWAETQGLGRRPSETTGQLQSRLATRVPEAAEAVDAVTTTYESERYGQLKPATDRLQRIRQALAGLLEGPIKK